MHVTGLLLKLKNEAENICQVSRKANIQNAFSAKPQDQTHRSSNCGLLWIEYDLTAK